MSEVARSLRQGAPSLSWGRVEKLLVLGIVSGTLALSAPAFWNQAIRWRAYEQFGHTYLMVAVAAWFVYANRAVVFRVLREAEPPLYGSVAVLGAATFEVLAFIGDLGYGAGLGVPLLIGAVAYAIAGVALVRAISLPLAFLTMMIPPGFLMDPLLVRLKLLVTGWSASILQRFGEPVIAEGNKILIPGHELFVADACSGLTSVFTMLPVACLVAFALLSGWWRRLVVIVSVIPVAISANVIRVVVTVKLVPMIGPEAAEGLLHQGFGVVAFGVGTIAVIGFARLLR